MSVVRPFFPLMTGWMIYSMLFSRGCRMCVYVCVQIRQVEFNTLRQSTIIRSLNFSIFNVAALLISCCTFVVYAWTGHSLTTEQTFTTISLFNVIRIPATLFFPLAVEVTSEVSPLPSIIPTGILSFPGSMTRCSDQIRLIPCVCLYIYVYVLRF